MPTIPMKGNPQPRSCEDGKPDTTRIEAVEKVLRAPALTKP